MRLKALSNAVRSARRESLTILIAWMLSCAWVIAYCGLRAYPDSPFEETSLLFGFPDWVVWGIALPWLACNVFTIVFCLFGIKDDASDSGES